MGSAAPAIPRMPDLPAELVGPRILTLLGVPGERQVPIEQMDALARAMADELHH